MKKLLMIIPLLSVLLMLNPNAYALDLSQVVSDSADSTTAGASTLPALGKIILMQPADAIKWAEANKTNPLARLPVYHNPNLSAFSQLYAWWKLHALKTKQVELKVVQPADEAPGEPVKE